MKKKNCKVDIVSVNLRYTEDSKEKLSFEEIITNIEVNNQEFSIRGKLINFSILENDQDFTIGFLTSSADKDLPAKINKKTKKISPLDVNLDESLVFGSIFLYSKILNTLFYEVNRDTLYLDGFVDFIYNCYNNSKDLKHRTVFDLKFAVIFRKNEYARALRMDIYKGFRVRIHQPKKLLAEIKAINSTVDKKIDSEFLSDIKNASELNSDSANIYYEVKKPKTDGGLTKDKVESFIKYFRNILKHGQIREKIDIIEIRGYAEEDSKKITPIDLIGDVYTSNFKIEVPRLNKDLQIKERTVKIKEVFNKEFKILNEFI